MQGICPNPGAAELSCVMFGIIWGCFSFLPFLHMELLLLPYQQLKVEFLDFPGFVFIINVRISVNTAMQLHHSIAALKMAETLCVPPACICAPIGLCTEPLGFPILSIHMQKAG